VALAFLGVAYIMSWIGDGMGGVPWTSIVGRAIPARRRGRLFATTQVLSGISRLAVSTVVGLLLSSRLFGFPANAALLILCCAVFMAFSWFFLVALREPAPLTDATAATAPGADNFLRYVARLPERFRARPDFAMLAVVQVLGSASAASMPFLVGYATRWDIAGSLPSALAGLVSRGGGALVGLFLAVQTLGLLCLAPVWGMVNDRFGPRTVLTGMFLVSLLCPVASLVGGLLGGSLALFLMAYFCFGAVQDGWVTITNYLLEAVPEAEQPTYIGLMNAASAPSLILPFLAGLLVRWAGEPALFICAALLLVLGGVVAVRLPETRRRTYAARTVQSP
jgi:MFS family permease